MEFLKLNSSVLLQRLSADADLTLKIINEAEDILSKKEDRILAEIRENREKARALLSIVTGKGRDSCEKFVEILKNEGLQEPSLQKCPGMCVQTVCVDDESNAVAPLICNATAKSVNVEVALQTPGRPSPGAEGPRRRRDGHPGSPSPGQHGDNAAVKSTVMVTGGSHFFGPIIHNSHVAEDVNVSVKFQGTSQVQGAPKAAQPPSSSIKGRSKEEVAASITDELGFLKVSFSKLVDRVTNVDSIVDELHSKGIHSELVANVRAEKTEQAKMRRLLENTKTSALADALLTALFGQQPFLMNELLSAHQD